MSGYLYSQLKRERNKLENEREKNESVLIRMKLDNENVLKEKQEQIRQLKNEIGDLCCDLYTVNRSISFRIGRIITYIPRKIRDLLNWIFGKYCWNGMLTKIYCDIFSRNSFWAIWIIQCFYRKDCIIIVFDVLTFVIYEWLRVRKGGGIKWVQKCQLLFLFIMQRNI